MKIQLKLKRFAKDSIIVRNQQPIEFGCPLDGRTGMYARVLSKEDQARCERELRPTEEKGWLEPTNTEFWGANRATIFGGERIFETANAMDTIHLSILRGAKKSGKPNTDVGELAIFHEYALSVGSDNTINSSMDNFLTLLSLVQKLESKGEKLGLTLFLTTLDNTIFSESPETKEIEAIFKNYFAGAGFNETRINTAISLLAQEEDQLQLEILWHGATFFSLIQNIGDAAKLKFVFDAKRKDVKVLAAENEVKFRALLLSNIKNKTMEAKVLTDKLKSV